MHKISRSAFLKTSFKAGSLVMLSQAGVPFLSKAKAEKGNLISAWFRDDDLMKRLFAANDVRVASILTSSREASGRGLGQDFAMLASAYTSQESKYYRDQSLIPALEKLIQALISYQSEDGTLNFGNLESPPDTGFLLESLSAGAFILAKDKSEPVSKANSEIKRFILKAGDGLVAGGVHTPNHRWVISSVLARLNELYPNKKYLDRIDDWVGEGIFMDKDGHYPERSQNYGNVENNSMITLGRLLNKPAFFAYPRKNLDMAYYYMEPNGDLVINDSRRQDQWSSKNIISFYHHYRYMAIKDNDGKFAAIARFIESMPGFEREVLNNSLYHFLENPVLQEKLPPSAQLPIEFEKLFTTSSLLRIRHAETTSTLFGGVDWPIIIASGRSNSPNFYAYRKGKAILKYMRMSANFFSMGYFYSDGLKKDGDKYVLYKKLEVPYYQPMPKSLRKADGDYKLSPSIDDRFWNKMDFSNRPVSNVKTLETRVTLTDNSGKNELEFRVTGPAGVGVTIELCFQEGGKLSGVTPGENGDSFLQNGEGTYELGGDTIKFGPGTGRMGRGGGRGLEGERYSTHFGSLRTEGMHVYLSGVTPFTHTLKFS